MRPYVPDTQHGIYAAEHDGRHFIVKKFGPLRCSEMAEKVGGLFSYMSHRKGRHGAT